MGEVLQDLMTTWAGGVVTSIRPDALEPNTSPRGWNSTLTSEAEGQAAVSKRTGLTSITTTPISGTPAVIGMYLFQPRDLAGDLNKDFILVDDAGGINNLQDNGTLTAYSDTMTGTTPPDFETAMNLCFIVNGASPWKIDSTGLDTQIFGIVAPAAPSIAAGGAGVMTGDYQVALSYYNDETGHESSTSPVSTITLAAQQLVVTLPTPTDPQVDFIRIHIRKTTLSAVLFMVTTGTGYDPNGQGWAVGTASVTLDLSDSDINGFIIRSPDEDENDPPPANLKYLCWHQQRMFGSDGQNLFYSKLGYPESWDPENEEPVSEDDGELITGLHSVGGVLLIYKTSSVHGLYGDDPKSWYLRLLDADTGCTSHRSIVTVEGRTYWWSQRGPVQLRMESQTADPIGFALIGETLSSTVLNHGQFHRVVCAPDYANQRVVFGVADVGETRQTRLLPFSYRLQRWESDKWDPMDAASLAEYRASTDIGYMVLGNYAGEVLKFDSATNDGVPSGTVSGSFVQSGTTLSVLTDALATFLTSGNGLKERKVTLQTASGEWVARARIASNTGTALTLASTISGLTNGATYFYYVGGPDFQWDTAWRDAGLPFYKKRYEFLFLELDAVASTNLTVELGFDGNPNYGQLKLTPLTPDTTTWNDAYLWAARSYAASGRKLHRLRVGRTGRVYRLRLRQPEPNKPVTVLKSGMQLEKQTTKLG